MSSPLECPDGSLQKLADKGLHFGIIDNKLVVALPYLNKGGELRRGYLAEPLNITNGTRIGVPANHQMHFAGEEPFQLNGASLLGVLGQASSAHPFFGSIQGRYHFSYKIKENGQPRNYHSLEEKVSQYFNAIAGPAIGKFPGCEQFVTDVDFGSSRESPFLFPDAHSAAAGLEILNDPFRDMVVGIIGVGGTGGYILDFLAKTPVKTIKLIDDDSYHVKNSFRSPGATNVQEFEKQKVYVYAARYATFRTGVQAFPERLSAENAGLIDDCHFVFVAVDRGSARQEIASILDARGKLYIDSGLGLDKSENGLFGQVRSTWVVDESRNRVIGEKSLPDIDPGHEEYLSNIQIAELNALNAAISVIRFKAEFGFYDSYEPWFNAVFRTARTSFVTQKL